VEWFIIGENILIFILGVFFGIFILALISAYYMLNTKITDRLKDNVLLVKHEDIFYSNNPENLREALDIWFTFLILHIKDVQNEIAYKNEKRAKRIFLFTLPSIILILLIASIASFTVHHI